MELKGKRLAILAESDFEDLELWYPLLRMREAGADVTVIGSGSSKSYTGKHGLKCEVDADIGEVRPEDFDGVIVPGGWAPDRLRRYPEVNAFVRDIYGAGKLVAMICHGGWVPISAGIVKGHRATCVSAIRDDLQNAGATYADEPVVRDRNLISSRVPRDLPDFCREIIAFLSEKK